MARGQDSTVTVAAVLAAIAAVVFGILALVFYTQLSGANQRAESATNDLNAYATRSEQSSPEVGVYKEQAGRGQSVVGVMLAENQQLRSIIGVDAALPMTDVDTQVKAKGDSSLLRTVTRLENDLEQAQAQVDAKEQALADVRGDLEEANRELATTRQRFNQAAQRLQAQFEQLAGAYSESMQKMDNAEGRYSNLLTRVRSDKDQQIREQQGSIQGLDQQVRQLERRVQQLIEQIQGEGQVNQVITPDGRIVAVADEKNQVYINLGKQDRLQLGLTFEVIPAGELIRTDREGEVRGIGTVEVIAIEENTAVCRIVRLERNAVLSESDSIVNVAYDRDRSSKFYVFGQFDFTDRGNPSQGDRSRIEGMVTRWGGELVDELNYEVDFLVLGVRPIRPAPLPSTVIDPVLIEQHARAIQNADQYERLLEQAQALSIPVLNQNRFLGLVGYYER
ncbi:hypothetical protein [Mucisphaera calidilacus]|uniref:Chromosome partition protein Smc n=1 Tax=Mucisphaera calidilacus TaxID=2527982 RepID=A0A518BXB8_9BACT|nr:hypothetical protein [Mucisphaera calidilacus]QDU71629.1 Chromosome partition protein Smc [Mucisphaera calidilacus]